MSSTSKDRKPGGNRDGSTLVEDQKAVSTTISSLIAAADRNDRAAREELFAALYAELVAYPGGEAPLAAHEPGIAIPLRLSVEGAELSFFSTISTFGTAVDITLAELSIEAFYPANARTAARLLREIGADDM